MKIDSCQLTVMKAKPQRVKIFKEVKPLGRLLKTARNLNSKGQMLLNGENPLLENPVRIELYMGVQ
jgi:hypothetical protein